MHTLHLFSTNTLLLYLIIYYIYGNYFYKNIKINIILFYNTAAYPNYISLLYKITVLETEGTYMCNDEGMYLYYYSNS